MTIVTLDPGAVLDYHTGVTARFKQPNETLVRYLRNFMRDCIKDEGARAHGMFYPVVRPGETITNDHGVRMAKLLGHDLEDAITYQVTQEMSDVMRGVYAGTVGKITHLSQNELPSEAGFAWLDDGWPIVDRGGVSYTIRAVSWHYMSAWTDGTLHDRLIEPQEWPCARLGLWVHVNDDPPEVRAKLYGADQRLGELQLMHSAVIPFDLRFEMPPEDEAGSAESFLGVVYLLWMFLGMEITGTHQAQIPRSFRRRAMRSLKHDEVHVVLLRKVRYVNEQTDDHRAIDWSCRWVVQGHYRHIKLAPDHEGRTHRAIAIGADKHCAVCGEKLAWVHPYIKGPDGRPMRISRTLMKLAR